MKVSTGVSTNSESKKLIYSRRSTGKRLICEGTLHFIRQEGKHTVGGSTVPFSRNADLSRIISFFHCRLNVVYFPQIGYLIVVPANEFVDMTQDPSLEQPFATQEL